MVLLNPSVAVAARHEPLLKAEISLAAIPVLTDCPPAVMELVLMLALWFQFMVLVIAGS